MSELGKVVFLDRTLGLDWWAIDSIPRIEVRSRQSSCCQLRKREKRNTNHDEATAFWGGRRWSALWSICLIKQPAINSSWRSEDKSWVQLWNTKIGKNLTYITDGLSTVRTPEFYRMLQRVLKRKEMPSEVRQKKRASRNYCEASVHFPWLPKGVYPGSVIELKFSYLKFRTSQPGICFLALSFSFLGTILCRGEHQDWYRTYTARCGNSPNLKRYQKRPVTTRASTRIRIMRRSRHS